MIPFTWIIGGLLFLYALWLVHTGSSTRNIVFVCIMASIDVFVGSVTNPWHVLALLLIGWIVIGIYWIYPQWYMQKLMHDMAQSEVMKMKSKGYKFKLDEDFIEIKDIDEMLPYRIDHVDHKDKIVYFRRK